MANSRGFTIVEVLIAIVILSIGLLGLLGASALVTRMIGRGQHSSVAATFAAQRMENLRASACTNQASGADTLKVAGVWVAVNSWTFANAGNSAWTIYLTSSYKTSTNRTRTDRFETEVSCLF